MICFKCGANNNDGASFCIKCGVSFINNQQINNMMLQQNSSIQMQSVNNQNTNNNQPKKNNTWLIILIVLLVVGGAIFFIFNGKGSSSDNITNNSVKVNDNNELVNDEINSSDLIIAVLGHKNHGKTELTSAITKYYGNYVEIEDLNNALEIKENNVIFNASKVSYKTKNKNFIQYDFPDNVDAVRGLLSGSIKLDGAILVVSASDGPMLYTRESIVLLQQIGVKNIVIFLDKSELVDDEELFGLVELETRELLTEYGFDGDNVSVIRGSSLEAIDGEKKWIQSIDNLMVVIDKWSKPSKNTDNAESHKKFKAEIYFLSKEENGSNSSFNSKLKPEIIIDNDSSKSSIELPYRVDSVNSGDNVELTVTLDSSINIKKGQYFKLSDNNKIIGVGVIVEIIE